MANFFMAGYIKVAQQKFQRMEIYFSQHVLNLSKILNDGINYK